MAPQLVFRAARHDAELTISSLAFSETAWRIFRFPSQGRGINGVELMLNTAYEDEARPPAPDSARTAAHDDTAIYLGCPDLDAAYAHLRSRGMNVNEPKVAPYGMKQVYVHDPDGYNLCFQWPAK